MRKITLTLIAILLITTGYVAAQVTKTTQITVPAGQTTVTINNDEPLQISDDLGLRIEGRHDGRVVGTLVVKVEGRWMDVQLATKNMQLGR